jgi:PAS domain S-box-containing protein
MFMPRLGQIGTRDVVTLPKEATIIEAASLMEDRNIRDVIVIFGEGDYRIVDVRKLLAYRMRSDDFKAPLSVLELDRVPTVSEGADVLEGMALIQDRCEHLCLLDDEGSLSGIVSYSDLLVTLEPKVLAESRRLGEVLVGTKFCTAPAETRVATLFEQIHASGHSEAIVTENGRAVGVLTRGDIIRLLAREDSLEGTVGEAAAKPLVGVPDTMNIQDAIAFSKAKHFKRIVVQNSKDEVVGVISQKELITLFYNRWSYFLTEQREELKRLNNELQEQKETLERIADTMGEGLYVMDETGVITHCNESMVRLLGYSKPELLGHVAHERFHAHYHNQNLPLEECPIYQTIQSRSPYEGVQEFVKKDGTVIRVRVSSHPLVKNDQVTGSVSTFSDISRELEMQEQVHESEAWFKGLFDLSPDGVVIIEPETASFRDFNRSAYEMLGYTKAEYAALTISQIDALDKPEEVERRVGEVIKKGRSDFETRHRKKDGSTIPVMVSVQAMELGGKPYIMATFRDIGEQVKARELIEESEAMLHTIYDVLPVGITITDPEGNIVDCNSASETLLGITREEHLSRNYEGKEWEIIRPDGTPMPSREFASVRALKEGKPVRDIEMGIVRDEGTVWLSVSAMPVEDPRFGVVVAYADVTERREYEIRLRDLSERLADQVEHEVAERLKNEAKYRNLFNAVPDAIIVHGFEDNGMPTNFFEVNDRACELFGMERGALLKLSPSDIRPEGEEPEMVKELARELMEKGMIEVEESMRRPDGTERIIQRLSVYQRIGIEPVVFTVMRDVTEKKMMEKEHELNRQLLIQQSKMAEMGSMVGIIAHQWKQPLNSIALIVQDIAESYDYGELDETLVHSHVDQAMQQVEFMGKTIDDFRSFFKPSKLRHRFKLTRCVNDTVALIRPQLDKHRVTTEIDGDDRIEVDGYENELKQVILNIVNNAKDAFIDNGTEDPRVDILVVKKDETAVLRIRDNAGGIPEDLLPDRLFEAFASTKGEQGTGVGLSLARQIVAKMDGSVRAFNSDGGAVFEITLPCAGERS